MGADVNISPGPGPQKNTLRSKVSGRSPQQIARIGFNYAWNRAADLYTKMTSDIAIAKRQGVASVGMGTYGNPKLLRYDDGQTKLSIGNYCSIADDVTILLGGNHRTDSTSTFPFRMRFDLHGKGKDGNPYSKGDVTIGHDVWIGYGSTIVSGVTIGNGSVVAAGSVVTKNVEPYTIVGGNPARPIRRRCSSEEAELMEQSAWWDWPMETVIENLHLIADSSISEYLKQCLHPTSEIQPD
ncbi:hypothetical protein GCM10009721_26490 [Terrabacter tumescens]|uniref:Acetyltransferase n=1 Tax=Terrabacter tumescens TaxID=60443 RepID=A0ABQ2I640_9MICO|nr:CatB-related O-acetyltransferase [Terrabacter tumescens]GGM98204.1 hypothetical protein GCM10009721_26490 [Terrabacter tumescens]